MLAYRCDCGWVAKEAELDKGVEIPDTEPEQWQTQRLTRCEREE
jgi:hypothetical protein